jgi:TolB-like protein
MSSIIEGYNYDIFISYRQKDNKHDGWVTEFVDNLKGELESTFKEDISVYFDENPHDRLQETHNVDKSLEDKLKCLIFIPILSQTYCDPSSYAWQNEFLAFIEMANDDRLGKDVKLRSGNVASRILPIRIHDLESEDVKLFEKEIGSVLRSMDFVFKTASGVNRPLIPEDDRNENLNKTLYRDQINKVAGAIKEIIKSMRKEPESRNQGKIERQAEEVHELERDGQIMKGRFNQKSKKLLLLILTLFLVIAGARVLYRVLNHGKQSQKLTELDKSIAVLPFVNDSPDKENEYFCNGMMEDILNNLAKIKELDVKSRTDVEAYRGVKKSRREIAKELGVSYLLEGSVRKQGNKFRIMVQLIDAETGFHMWSQPYESEFSDVFAVQADIAKKVADELRAVISIDEKKEIESIPTTNIEAYEYYIMGKQEASNYWSNHEINDLKKSLELLNKAILLDPEFVEAILDKGTLFAGIRQYDSARVCANRLITINPTSFNAYSLLGHCYRSTNDPLPAIENYKNALRYSDNQKKTVIKQTELWIGTIYCMNLKNYKEGYTYLQKAIDSTSYVYWMYLGAIFNEIGDFERAEKYSKASVGVDSSVIAVAGLSLILTYQSKFDLALEVLDKYCNPRSAVLCLSGKLVNHILKKEFDKALRDVDELKGSVSQFSTIDSVYTSYLYKNIGRDKEADNIIAQTLKSFKKLSLTDKGSTPYLFSSYLYGMSGNKEKSLENLSKAIDIGLYWGSFNVLDRMPFYDSYKNDPEFKAIVKKAKDKAAKSRSEIDEMRKQGEIDL